jgi:hypothetical protein
VVAIVLMKTAAAEGSRTMTMFVFEGLRDRTTSTAGSVPSCREMPWLSLLLASCYHTSIKEAADARSTLMRTIHQCGL